MRVLGFLGFGHGIMSNAETNPVMGATMTVLARRDGSRDTDYLEAFVPLDALYKMKDELVTVITELEDWGKSVLTPEKFEESKKSALDAYATKKEFEAKLAEAQAGRVQGLIDKLGADFEKFMEEKTRNKDIHDG